MLRSLIDRLAIEHALARCPHRSADEEIALERLLPSFSPDGTRVGDWTLRFDW